jgi:hypothetical protein
MNRLQKALQYNAIFSGVSGFLFILGHQWLANIFTLNNSSVFWIIGIALVFFAGTIFYEITKQRRWAVLWIIIQDFLWVIGSAILLIFNPFGISSTGNILIAIVALIVLAMGINQYKAISNQPKND